MIHVLSSWNEIRDSYRTLTRGGHPLHPDIAKLWDFTNIVRLFGRPEDRETPFIDLGSGTFRPGTVDLLASLGYRSILGVDQYIPRSSALRTAVPKYRRGDTRIRFMRRDITNTRLPNGRFQHATCVSVIEHGLNRNLAPFFDEVRRIVREGGLLYVSTDYWPEHDIPDRRHGVLPMHVFDEDEIRRLCTIAGRSGWGLLGGAPAQLAVPEERVVCYAGAEYTFIAMAFEAR